MSTTPRNENISIHTTPTSTCHVDSDTSSCHGVIIDKSFYATEQVEIRIGYMHYLRSVFRRGWPDDTMTITVGPFLNPIFNGTEPENHIVHTHRSWRYMCLHDPYIITIDDWWFAKMWSRSNRNRISSIWWISMCVSTGRPRSVIWSWCLEHIKMSWWSCSRQSDPHDYNLSDSYIPLMVVIASIFTSRSPPIV